MSAPDPALIAIARDVEALRRSVEDLRVEAGRAQETGNSAHRVLADLADRVHELASRAPATGLDPIVGGADGEPVPSWLTNPNGQAVADLVAWLGQVLVHYPDVVETLGECWPHHPWAVEELLALQAAWAEAYTSGKASGAKAVDWHDRHRPACLTRIARVTAGCSVHAHQPGGRLDLPVPTAPGADQVTAASDRWISAGRGPA